MPIESWLTDTLEIQRHLVNSYFIVMAIFALVALILAWRTRFKWLSLYLWMLAGTIGLVWESTLFAIGSREYTLFAIGELGYHALTEGGPGLIITVIVAHYVGIIDAERFRDPSPGGEGPVEGRKLAPPEGILGERAAEDAAGGSHEEDPEEVT